MERSMLELWKLGRTDFWRRIPFKARVKYVSPQRPRRVPAKVQIEATSRCNLRCASCSHSREQGKGQHLAPQDFREVLNRLPRLNRVVLSGIGEPLLNPQFFALVDILAERGARCEFHTNGTLLVPAVQREILARSNIDTVNISCDGAQASTFEDCRVGASFARWKDLVRQFLAEAKQVRPDDFNTGVNVVVSKRNLGEIRDIIRLAAELGFDSVYVLDPIPLDDVAASLCPSWAELSTLREEELSALASGLGLKLRCFFRRRNALPRVIPRCTQPWEYVFVRATGDVAPCCALFGSDKGAVMGNILRQGFEEIWRGDRFRQFRRSSASGTNGLCRVCPYY